MWGPEVTGASESKGAENRPTRTQPIMRMMARKLIRRAWVRWEGVARLLVRR